MLFCLYLDFYAYLSCYYIPLVMIIDPCSSVRWKQVDIIVDQYSGTVP